MHARFALAAALALVTSWPASPADAPRPRIAPRITPQVARDFYACAAWEDWKARPVPSPERAALALGGGIARRGPSLRVGRHVLRNIRSSEEIEREWFQYVGRLANAPVDVVLDHPYEGVRWVALDRQTRARENLRGLPVASPNGRWLAVAASDFVFDMNGVEVWERTDRGFVQVGDLPRRDYPCDLHWTGDERLEFAVALQQTDEASRRGDPRVWRPASLTRQGGVWVYEGPPPHQDPP